MTGASKFIGIDIGGSHASFSIVETGNDEVRTTPLIHRDLDSTGSAVDIITTLTGIINDILLQEPGIKAVGVAFPGPFDYKKGVSIITGVGGKFKSTFGVHIQQALKSFTGLPGMPFIFANDAHCFATGAYRNYSLKSKRTVFLTLGTGFGSAFMVDGNLIHAHPSLPASGLFYNEPFLDGMAEDYISTRWFVSEYAKRTGNTITSVKELAAIDNEVSRLLFWQFGNNLGMFLEPWLKKYECDEIVIGGNIVKSKKLFALPLVTELLSFNPSLNIHFCLETEECTVTGAAIIAGSHNENPVTIHSARKTTQEILPISIKTADHPEYNIYPSFKTSKPVYEGFDSLAELICSKKTVVIDGYGGVLWENFRIHLQKALQIYNKTILWYDINSCLKPPAIINRMLSPYLNGDDPVFGNKFTGELGDFFDSAKFNLLQPDKSADICILYGTGAALSNWEGLLIYVDLPKNEIQYRMRAGKCKNLGAENTSPAVQMYKRFYFVDWPVYNKHKANLLPRIDSIVDEQRIDSITWMNGPCFRELLTEMSKLAIRPRPWFEAGIWGGQWMKNKIPGLNKTEINYAWSFELITPENGLVIEGSNYLLEVSFDFLMFHNHTEVLGKAAGRFGTDFPIRFDFLDTFDGGNLSVQCHPRPDYIRKNFGEKITQDETYYILDCKKGAAVYLGFQNDIDPVEFKDALYAAQEKGTEIQVEKFVQRHDARKHDLFLIPNGTIHASGIDNLVLEISNTPYIFTFKMYDWLRKDLNGQPRPINIEHAFNNLYFERKGETVKQQLISHPRVAKEWSGGRKLNLPTHPDHFYTVDRYEFTGEISILTNNLCHCCMLVEGESIRVITGEKENNFSYAETFIIPASADSYRVCVNGNETAYLIVAYIKEDFCSFINTENEKG